MEGYDEFRRGYTKSTKRIKNRYKQNYKTDVALATLKGEIIYFRQFLRWSAMRGFYKGGAYEWRYKTDSKIGNRREPFSLEQYRTLVRYIRTAHYIIKGKHSDNGTPDKRVIGHRQMLRCYIPFLCNTGLRVGECRALRHRDVTFTTSRLSEKVCVIELDQTLPK
jgi:integrase